MLSAMAAFVPNIDIRALPAVAIATVAPSLATAACEEPDYDVIAETALYELRRYDSYLVAEVTVSEDLAVPARTVAVRRYSGFWSERNYRKQETLLLSALTTDNIKTRGAPLLARYNGPFTPWFLRRNEVMIDVDPASVRAAAPAGIE